MDDVATLLLPRSSANLQPGGVFGVMPAIVLAVFDEGGDKRHLIGMVQVWFPTLQDKNDPNLIKPWARLCMSAGGRGYEENQEPTAFDNPSRREGCGLYTPPTVGDEVLCAFEHGDLHHPYIIGTLWNGVSKAPKVADVTGKFKKEDTVSYKGHDDAGGGKHAPLTYDDLEKKEKVGEQRGNNANRLWFWRSRSGHVLIFDDSKDHPKVIITTASGKQRIVLDQEKGKVQIVSGGCKCLMGQHPHEGDCQPDPVYQQGKAKGNQDDGSNDDWDGGDVEILAANRLWIKARKINVISSHNTSVIAGNHWKLKADGMLTMSSRYNTEFEAGRAFAMTIGKIPDGMFPFSDGCAPPGTPGGKGDKGDTGQWVVETKGKIEIKSTGIMSQDIVLKAQPGQFDLTAVSGIKTQTPATIQHSCGGSMTTSSGGAMTTSAGGAMTTSAGGAMTTSAGGAMTVMAGGAMTVMAGGAMTQMAGGAMTQMAGGAMTQMAGGASIRMAGGAMIHMAGGAMICMAGGANIDMAGGAQIGMAGGANIRIAGGIVLELSALNVRASAIAPSGLHPPIF